MELNQVWRQNLQEAQSLLKKCLDDETFLENLIQFSRKLIDAFKEDANLFICGNGGSHCDAMHFAEELTGRYRKERKALGALALGDPSHITCVANDYGYEAVFSRQLEALARKNDFFVGISTSGNSKNVIKAAQSAKSRGLYTVALMGKDGGKLKSLVDLPIIVPSQATDRIQEIHIKIIHTVIQSVERELFPENY